MKKEEAADILENITCFISNDDSLAKNKISKEEYIEYISALRFAISNLRGKGG